MNNFPELLLAPNCVECCDEVILRGLVGLIIVRPFVKDFFPFLVAAGFTTIMACCGHSVPSLLH